MKTLFTLFAIVLVFGFSACTNIYAQDPLVKGAPFNKEEMYGIVYLAKYQKNAGDSIIVSTDTASTEHRATYNIAGERLLKIIAWIINEGGKHYGWISQTGSCPIGKVDVIVECSSVVEASFKKGGLDIASVKGDSIVVEHRDSYPGEKYLVFDPNTLFWLDRDYPPIGYFSLTTGKAVKERY